MLWGLKSDPETRRSQGKTTRSTHVLTREGCVNLTLILRMRAFANWYTDLQSHSQWWEARGRRRLWYKSMLRDEKGPSGRGQ